MSEFHPWHPVIAKAAAKPLILDRETFVIFEGSTQHVPTYEYRCVECDNRYETREGFDAPSSQPCPRCGARARRVFSPPPIVFKGSGWYITDSRKGSSATVASGSNGDEAPASAAASAAAPTETKAAEPAKAAAGED